MHPPNYMFHNPYSHSPYATPGNSGYPQGPASGNYPPGAGGSYPPVGGVSTSVKYPSGPYKPGTTAGGAPGASAYGGYGAGPGGYGGAPAVSSANATGYEDLSASQYKESNLYIPGQQVRKGAVRFADYIRNYVSVKAEVPILVILAS